MLNLLLSFQSSFKNATIEERVSLLEIQVVEIEEDLTDLGDECDSFGRKCRLPV